VTQGDIKDPPTYTTEANILFKEQIGEEMDARDMKDNTCKLEDINKMHTINAVTERKNKKKEQMNMRNKQTSVNALKDITSKDKPRDMFKDLMKSVGNDLIKDDV
jgi:hypothetical protein